MSDLRRTLQGSDVDDNGNVIVWDHGPADDPHDHPVPITMSAGDAGHAMNADDRYALEPDIDDGEIEEEMAKIKADREAAAQAATDRAEAIQLAADRKAALTIVAARHAADPAPLPAEPEAAPPPDYPPPAYVPDAPSNESPTS